MDAFLEKGDDGGGVFEECGGFVAFVKGGEAAAGVEGLDDDAVLGEFVDEGEGLGDGFGVGFGKFDGGADVEVEAMEANVFGFRRLSVEVGGAVDVNAELVFLAGGEGFGVGGAVLQIGVDAECGVGSFMEFAGDAVEVPEFFFGFDVERFNVGVKAFADFVIGFADAGEEDFIGSAAGFEGAEEFAAGGDVDASAFGNEGFGEY